MQSEHEKRDSGLSNLMLVEAGSFSIHREIGVNPGLHSAEFRRKADT
jgi:hypothetical protein